MFLVEAVKKAFEAAKKRKEKRDSAGYTFYCISRDKGDSVWEVYNDGSISTCYDEFTVEDLISADWEILGEQK